VSDDSTLARDEWPAYRVGNRDYVHALGVISALFNKVEFNLRKLFPLYVRLPLSAAYQLFVDSNNAQRAKLMRECIVHSSHPDSIKDDVKYFLDCYMKCAENRNVLLHATLYFIFGPGDIPCPSLSPPGFQPQGVGLQKFARGDPFQINTYELSIEELRKHADDLHAIDIYGDRLYWHILKNYEPDRYKLWGFPEEAKFALPNRPASPSLLVPRPPRIEPE
jgi:hypothetical protein